MASNVRQSLHLGQRRSSGARARFGGGGGDANSWTFNVGDVDEYPLRWNMTMPVMPALKPPLMPEFLSLKSGNSLKSSGNNNNNDTRLRSTTVRRGSWSKAGASTRPLLSST